MSTRARHHRNRVCTVFVTAVVLTWTLGAFFLFPSHSISGAQTHIGFLGWTTLDHGGVIVHQGRLIVSLLIALAVIAFAAYFLRRTFEYFGWELVRSEGCPVCDYSLAGRRYGGCPECGWSMTPVSESCGDANASVARPIASGDSRPARPRARVPA